MATDSPNHGRCVGRRHSAYADCGRFSTRALVTTIASVMIRNTLPDTAAPHASYKETMFLARAMTVSRNPNGRRISPEFRQRVFANWRAKARLGACLLSLRGTRGRSVMPTANKPCVLFEDAASVNRPLRAARHQQWQLALRYAVWRAIVT